MSFTLPEIVIQRLITIGIKRLRADQAAFYDLFAQYNQGLMVAEYGPDYLDQLWDWFSVTKLPVVQAWSFNAQKIPCISVHLATEQEAEDKAAIGDVLGDSEEGEIGTGVFTVMVDIGIHANKAGDHVLWMYYIVSYILFKNKLLAESMGLRLHTFSASDYNKNSNQMMENIWTRWVRFRCTTQNYWTAQEPNEIEEINMEYTVDNPPADQIVAGSDVDPSTIIDTVNKGILVSSRGDKEGKTDQNI